MLPGIINLRGQILTTFDLKTRLNLFAAEFSGQSMMMVVQTSEGPMNLLVDKIGPVLDVDPDLFEPPTETLKPAVRAVTIHVCKLEGQLLLVLDTEKIIRLPAACRFPEALQPRPSRSRPAIDAQAPPNAARSNEFPRGSASCCPS